MITLPSSPVEQAWLTAIKRVLAECLFVGHGFFAVAWWWLMPGGFSAAHIRFWTNAVWPFALLIVGLAGLWSIIRKRPERTKACALWLAIMSLSAVVAAVLIFPDIKRAVVLAALAIGIAELGLAVALAAPWISRIALSVLTLSAIALGSFVPVALRAEPASTHPRGEACPWAEELARTGRPLNESTLPIGESDRVTVFPAAGTVSIKLGRLRLDVEPLLTFVSTSRSGGWSILSRQGPERSGAVGRLTQMLSRPGKSGRDRLLFGGPGDWVSVEDGPSIEISAYGKIAEPIYSHLNSFCVLSIQGHQDLQLEFSPCGSKRFEPMPADYPVGRPARFAYFGADRVFHVAQASSGEKGPFNTLGEGRLESSARLSIGLVDDGQRIADVHLDDWLAQSSTELSPTAGWGAPVNAIEFQRLGTGKQDAVMIWITLAATSVGRGWDTVGHSAGIYRNRIEVELAHPQ